MTPRSRTFHRAFAARAARKQTMFAMLPPLTQQAAAINRVADERGDPPHRLRLDLRRGR